MAIQRGAYNRTGDSTGIQSAKVPVGIQRGPYNNTREKGEIEKAADNVTADFGSGDGPSMAPPAAPPPAAPPPMVPPVAPPPITQLQPPPPLLSPPPPTTPPSATFNSSYTPPKSEAELKGRQELAGQLKEFAQNPSSSPNTIAGLTSSANKLGVKKDQLSYLYKQYAAQRA